MTTTEGSDNNAPPPPRRHVAVCAFPFGTHAAPLLLLVKRLAASSPDIHFTFLNTVRSNATLFKAINVTTFPNIVPRAAVPEEDDGHAPPGKFNPMRAVGLFFARAPAGLRQSMAAAEAEVGAGITCVIFDAFLWFCEEIAVEKGVAWIPLWTANTASLSAHVHTDFLRTKFEELQGKDGKDEMIADCVPGFSHVRYKDLPDGILAGDLNSPFSQMLHKMGLTVPKATAVVVNSSEELLPKISSDLKSKMKLLCVGPFPLTSPPQIESNDQYRCLPWLDKQEAKSVAYISFGTVGVPPQEELVALAEALEDAKVPFIWSMNDSLKSDMPSSFKERISNDEMVGMIVPWAPQMEILRHPSVGVFVTHCGWNSILESIVTGVPVICRPILGDQMLNQRLVESEWRFGIGIAGRVITKAGAIKALNQVLSSEEGKQMRENVKKLKEVAEESIKEGASSNENFKVLIELVTS